MKCWLILVILFLFTLGGLGQSKIKNQELHRIGNINCNNWLKTNIAGDCIKIGDLDISGNKITVEAMINRTAPYSGGYNYGGDIVSKHQDPNNVNYLLRPNNAEITTDAGFFTTAPICEIELNKTYHVAFVYDGSTLKFYRNGYLMSQVNATGNLFQNDFITTIGDWAMYTSPVGTNFVGLINEVRIWNIARTQSQIQTYMNNPIPNPNLQTGLQAYYSFDNALNKQGNSTWNGTITNGASINNNNINCIFTPDNCNFQELIINDYTPVLDILPCMNKVYVEDPTEFSIGDTVLLIQMQGASIDTTNSTTFGNITNLNNAGNYEFNIIESKTGNELLLKNQLTRTYDVPDGKVQLVRVPYFANPSIEGILTCLPWDGNKGGILVFNAAQTITLKSNIDVSGKGFRAEGLNTVSSNLNCGELGYSYPFNDGEHAGRKGEGIATSILNKMNGRGKYANGGGGGNANNSGGGGGSNAGAGGSGGYQLDQCNQPGIDNRGIAGSAIPQNSGTNKIFMGGAGGSGHANNLDGFTGEGGNGGGIVIIMANSLVSNGFKIKSNGSEGMDCNKPGLGCHEGMGGGGAGGTILINVGTFSQQITMEANGGKGADMVYGSIGKVGPGGGGGGGSIWFNSSSLPNNVTTNSLGGENGVCINFGSDPYGTSEGSNGYNLFNLNIPISNVPFIPSIDSVKINYNENCTLVEFQGLGYSQNNGIVSWNWDFGDGNISTLQNPTYNYSNSGNYTVRLLVTGLDGCTDSAFVDLSVVGVSAEAGNDTSYCINTAVTHVLHGNVTGSSFTWSPAAFLDNSNILNPTATLTTTTKFYLTSSDQSGCTTTDSVTIHVNPTPDLNTIEDTTICQRDSLQLISTGTAMHFAWSPAAAVHQATDPSPWFIGNNSTQMIVTGSTDFCETKDTVNIIVNPLPLIQSIADTNICTNVPIILSTTGGLSYNWQSHPGISDLNIPSPSFSWNNTASIQLFVTGTDINNCSATDSIKINVIGMPDFQAPENVETCLFSPAQLNGNNGNEYEYSWIPVETLSDSAIINPIANPSTTTTYQLTVKETRCGFAASFPVTVTVNLLPEVQAFKSGDIDCSNPVIQLSALGASQYSWSPHVGLSDPEISNPTLQLNEDGYYVVIGTNTKGCIDTDTIFVKVTQDNPPQLFIPNTFTPNGDGLNDCFGVSYWSLIENFEIKIFNRFGDAVYQSTDLHGCWNGQYKGRAADIGNYVYFIRGNTACGPIFKKGNLLLLR